MNIFEEFVVVIVRIKYQECIFRGFEEESHTTIFYIYITYN